MKVPFPVALGVVTFLLVGCTHSHPTGPGATPPPSPPKSGVVWPGKKSDGSVQLPNQWSLRPFGSQLELADFPVNVAVHPSGAFAAILHCGYSQHQILCVAPSSGKIISTNRVAEAFYGLEFSR